MTRKKVKLAFIANDSSRKATFKKRKKGLMKKVSELSTLCGIEACAIVYSPYEPQPEVWPDGRAAHQVLAQFKRMPEMEKSKKMVNQETFIRNRITKASDQLKKLHQDNREKEVTHLMYQCLTGKELQGVALSELNDMGWLLDQKLKDIYKRIEMLKKEAVLAETKQETKENVVVERQHQQQQLFMDWMGSSSDHSHYQAQQQMHGGGVLFGSGGGRAEEMMLHFNDVYNHNPAAIWSSAFFP